MNEIEYDSDEEPPKPVAQKSNKLAYTHATRDVSNKKMKKNEEIRVEDYDSDDEAYNNMLLKRPEDSDDEDDLQRQLRLEREEAQRIKEQGEKKN